MKERVKNVLNFKKPSRVIIILAVVFMAVLSVGFAANQVSGKQPFKDINTDEITSILLYCSPPDVSVSIEEKSTISEIVEILRTVVTYEKDYLGEMYAGQLVQYTLTMQSGESIEIGALGSFIVIDGQRYKTKYEPSEELNRLGNQLRGDKKSPYQQAVDIINEHYPEASEIISSGSETINYSDSSESIDVYTFEVVIDGERVICAISKDSGIFFTYNDKTGWTLPSLGDRRPMVLIEDLIYMDTGKEVSVETDKIITLGTILSSVDGSEIPTQNGQSNFGCVGSDYAYYEDGVIVKLNGKWILFVAESVNEAQEMQDTKYNISLSNLRQLAAKGDKLIFEDFSKYKGQDVGFGAYILRFEIEGGYELLVGGSAITGKPMNATLCVPGVEDNIDIRYENIDEFIGKYPIMPQDIGTDWTTYDANGNLIRYHTIDENGNDVYFDFEPEKTKANTEMNGHYFVNETIDCINGESGEHKKSNGIMATYTNDGGTWALESGQEVTITFRIKAVEDHESGQGIVFGYLKDGIYTKYSETRLLNETTISFTATEDGAYCFFFINASSDTIHVENCTISK